MTNYELTQALIRLRKKVCCLSESTGGDLTFVTTEDSPSIAFTGSGTVLDPLSATVIGLGDIPNLQEVTDEGNSTTNSINVEEALITAPLIGGGVSLTAFGAEVITGAALPSSHGSVAIGYQAAFAGNMTQMTAVGHRAGAQTSSGSLAAFGSFSGAGNVGNRVAIFGNYQSLSNNGGSDVIAIGSDALINNSGSNVITAGSLVNNTISNIITLGWDIDTSGGVTNALYLKPSPSSPFQSVIPLDQLSSNRVQALPDNDGTFLVNGINGLFIEGSEGASGNVLISSGAGSPAQWGSTLNTLNGLSGSSQTFLVGTAGTNFAISSAGTTHTFNLPDASATARGVMTTGSQTIAGNKTFSGNVQVNGLQTNTSSSNSSFIAIGSGVISSATADIALEGAATGHYRTISNGSGATLNANTSYATLYLRGTGPTEAATGTHPLISNLAIKSLTLVGGAGATTNTASLYVEGAMTGVTPTNAAYAVWSKAGLNRFGGGLVLDTSNLTAQAGLFEFNGTDFTGVSGTTKYVIPRILSNTAVLDFPSTLTQTSSDLTITVTGAVVGDVVALGTPNASVLPNSDYSAWVSAADTVTVRFTNYGVGAADPASGTFKVTVIK